MGRTYKISIIRLVTQTIAFMSSPVTLQGTSAKSTTVPPKRPEKNKKSLTGSNIPSPVVTNGKVCEYI